VRYCFRGTLRRAHVAVACLAPSPRLSPTQPSAPSLARTCRASLSPHMRKQGASTRPLPLSGCMPVRSPGSRTSLPAPFTALNGAGSLSSPWHCVTSHGPYHCHQCSIARAIPHDARAATTTLLRPRTGWRSFAQSQPEWAPRTAAHTGPPPTSPIAFSIHPPREQRASYDAGRGGKNGGEGREWGRETMADNESQKQRRRQESCGPVPPPSPTLASSSADSSKHSSGSGTFM
jgi:hypothetical protein